MEEKVLIHHGIKGQQWGERNGPPYPLDRKTKKSIKKAANKYKKTVSENKKRTGSYGYKDKEIGKLYDRYYDEDEKREVVKKVNELTKQIVRYEESKDSDYWDKDGEWKNDKTLIKMEDRLSALNDVLVKENSKIANEINNRIIDEYIRECNLSENLIDAGKDYLKNEYFNHFNSPLIYNVYDAYDHL